VSIAGCRFTVATNGHALDGRAIYNFLPERLPVNEQKAEILIHSSSKNFQPGTTAQ
jgi:hypothetical protein